MGMGPILRDAVVSTTSAVVILAAILVGGAAAETVTFDDLPAAGDEFALPTLEQYKGLRWRGFEVIKATHETLNNLPRCGYRTGRVSGDYVAIVANRYGQTAEITGVHGEPFNFHSVYLTAGWKNQLAVLVEGFRAGVPVYAKSVVVDTDGPTLFTFDFRAIDALRISATGGVDAGVCQSAGCRPGPEVVLDDFTFTFASGEPAPAPGRLSAGAAPPQVPEIKEKPPAGADAPAEARAGEEAGGGRADVPEPRPVSRIQLPAAGACPEGARYGVQVGVFRSQKRAEDLRERMASRYGAAQIAVKQVNAVPFYRVIVGCLKDSSAARELVRKLRSDGTRGFVTSLSRLETDAGP